MSEPLGQPKVYWWQTLPVNEMLPGEHSIFRNTVKTSHRIPRTASLIQTENNVIRTNHSFRASSLVEFNSLSAEVYQKNILMEIASFENLEVSLMG